MNKKGFTLVELLAIIVLIGIIAIVAIPSMTQEIASNEEKTKTLNETNIENAVKLYVAKYYANDAVSNLSCSGEQIYITLQMLKDDGLLSLPEDSPCNSYKDKKFIKLCGNAKLGIKLKDGIGKDCYSKGKEEDLTDRGWNNKVLNE